MWTTLCPTIGDKTDKRKTGLPSITLNPSTPEFQPSVGTELGKSHHDIVALNPEVKDHEKEEKDSGHEMNARGSEMGKAESG